MYAHIEEYYFRLWMELGDMQAWEKWLDYIEPAN